MANGGPRVTQEIEELLREYDQAAARDDSESLRRISQEIADRCLAAGAEELAAIARRVKAERDGARSS